MNSKACEIYELDLWKIPKLKLHFFKDVPNLGQCTLVTLVTLVTLENFCNPDNSGNLGNPDNCGDPVLIIPVVQGCMMIYLILSCLCFPFHSYRLKDTSTGKQGRGL